MKKRNEFDINHYKFLCDVYEAELKSSIKNQQSIDHCLSSLREYLDKCGFRMKKPQYRFVLEDISTHKYLPSTTVTKKTVTYEVKEILNPLFRKSA